MSNLAAQPDAPSDAELISRVRAGDQAAYGELFERHREAAQRMARQLVHGPDIDDLISEAFTKVFVQLQRGGGPDVAFRAYLLTSIRRLHVDRARTNQRVQVTDDLEDLDRGVDFIDPATSDFERGAASRAFASLPERWQLVLWHLEVEGQKPADIAPLLGMSPNSVAALAYRAREGLRQAYLQSHLADTADEGCRWTTEHLGAYVRKGLAKRDSAKVESHLDGCHRCTAVYLELTEVNSNLSGLLAPALLGLAAPGYLAASGTKIGLLLLWPWTKLKEAGAGAQAGAAGAAVAAVVAVAAVAGVFGGGGDDTNEASEPSTQQPAPDQQDPSPDNQQEPKNTPPDTQQQDQEARPDEEPPPDEEDPPETDGPPENDPPPDTVPDTPTDVTGDIRGSNVVLRWDAVDDARGYRVYRKSSPAAAATGVTTGVAATGVDTSGPATTVPASYAVPAANAVPASYAVPVTAPAAYPAARPGVGPVVSDGTIQRTSFRDNSLVDGNKYRYVVTAVRSGDESQVSEPVTVTYNPVPSAPEQVRTRERDSGIALRWAANSEPDIDEYRILRDGEQVGTSSTPRFTDASAADGSTYAYTVVALDRSGQESDESRSVDATYDPVPAAPTGVSVEERGAKLALTWDENTEPDIDGYLIYRDGERIAGTNGTRYVDRNAPDGETAYTVTALDDSDQESDESGAVTIDAGPDRPRGVDATEVGRGIKVTWERADDSDIDGYIVERGGEKVAETDQPRYLDSDVVDGESYTYRIVAVDDGRNRSPRSRPAKATYDPAPDAPTGLTATVRGDRVVLRWGKNNEPDLEGYVVYRDDVRITPGTIDERTYVDTDLTDGEKYTYTVRAVDRSDQESPESEPASATYDPVPSAPTGLTAIEVEGGIRLDWEHDAHDDVTGYVVIRVETSTDKRTELPVPLVSTYVDYTAIEGTSYAYTVYAIDASGKSEESNAVTGVWQSPEAPTDLEADGKSGKIALSWAANQEPDVDGYIIYRDGVRIGTTTGRTSTNFDDETAVEGAQYRYTVVAVDRAGNESSPSISDPGSWDDSPSPPTNLTCSMQGSSLHFEWAPSPDADVASYIVTLDGSPLDSVEGTTAVDHSHTGAAPHLLSVTAVDSNGNESKPATQRFQHDAPGGYGCRPL